jgi:nucleotide-binding universal stress UspA family protein
MTNHAKEKISNPARYYETPEDVLGDDKLSHDDKIKILSSMALDAHQMVEATSEGMSGANVAYNADDLQAALTKLEEINKPNVVDDSSQPTARFQRIMVVTTVNQDLNRTTTDVAFDMAEITGGKVHLLNVVPSAFERTGFVAAGPMGIATPPPPIDNTQIIEDRNALLTELRVESGSSVETEIEVRSGQIEQVIVEYASDCDADLVVVGSPNRSWLEALFEPSMADSVTKSASCPVLVVPELT